MIWRRRWCTCAKRAWPRPPKKAGRTASEGHVGSYIHAGGKIGVLIEVNCETDFVARTQEFQNLVKDLAMQVAAANPRYVRREEMPAEVLEAERSIYRAQASESGKPAAGDRKDRRRKGREVLRRHLSARAAVHQGTDSTVGRLVTDAVAQLGENIVVRRFARFQLGETVDAVELRRRGRRGTIDPTAPARRRRTCGIGASCSS